MNKDSIIFRCDCGHYGIMTVDHFDDEGFWFSFVEEPKTLWQRIKSFFQSKRFISEINLTEDNAKDLVKFLKTKNDSNKNKTKI